MNMRVALIAGALAVVGTQSAEAADIKVLTAGAFKQVLRFIVASFESINTRAFHRLRQA